MVITCGLVSRRWRTLANDQTLWKALSTQRGWKWKQPQAIPIPSPFQRSSLSRWSENSDDEGMGSSDEEDTADVGQDSGFVSMVGGMTVGGSSTLPRAPPPPLKVNVVSRVYTALPSSPAAFLRADYRLLFQTHLRLLSRFLSSSYRLSALQTRGSIGNAHSNTIYCLQLYTYPETGMQVLFTGSRDWTVREWNVNTRSVVRVIEGVHEGSVLSICAHGGYLATAGSDRKIVLWDLANTRLVKVIMDHEDGVLCVRFNDKRLVSCSKGE
jgi:WD40 repeat protein